MIEVKEVSVKYKNIYGIKNASFTAENGEIVGLIGADGAGKSSLLHAISGVITFEGEILYDNHPYHSPKETEKFKQNIGLMPQGLGLVLYDFMSIKEHFDFFREIRGIKKDIKYENRLLNMAGLAKFQDRLARNLSGGMRQKLSLILTLLHRPKLLILDEPTTGVDPVSRIELWDIVNEMREKDNITALISTAYMQEAEKMDRVMLFDEGQIIASGKANELIKTVEPYTYQGEIKCEKCVSFNKKTYSLNNYNLPKAKPDLEALFFVNALQKNRELIDINLPQKEIKFANKVVMKAEKLTKKFGQFIADDSIDMELKRGEILGLLGANGAGKTTFIKMLLGLYPMDGGKLTLLDKEIKSYKDRLELKSKIGYVSQKFALYDDMTVRENMHYFASMHKIPILDANKKIKEYAKLLGFEKYMDKFPKELPLGINQRFSIAVAILHSPVVLFLDEPTSGVDTIARSQFWKLVKELKEKMDMAILITTHYMSEAEYCDRVVLLKAGKKIADDTVENLHKKFASAKNFEEIFIRLIQ